MIEHLIADYQESGDAVLRMLALEQRHAALKRFLDMGRVEHRRWVTHAFGTKLGALEGAAREMAIDMLVIATDVYTWKILHRDMGRSSAATQQTMKNLAGSLLAEF